MGVQAKREEFSADLGGAIFYGMCATNIVPGSAVVGATIYTVYSFLKISDKRGGDYLTAFVIGKSLHTIADWVIQPLFKHFIFPLTERIWNVVSAILKRISLPKHPIWWGVAVLVLAFAFYKGSSLLADSSKAIGVSFSFQSPIVLNDCHAAIPSI